MRKKSPYLIAKRKRKELESHVELHKHDSFKYWMAIIAQFSQVALVFVAIFGYFYTVRPIHQKEMLEEKMILLESEIENARLLMPKLQAEKDLLTKQVAQINNELEEVSEKKEKIENSIRHMEYKYHLPDGKPAKTDAEVNKALDYKIKEQTRQLKKEYLESYNLRHILFTKDKNGNPYPFLQTYSKVEPDSDYFPFYKSEYEVLNGKKGIDVFLKNVALEQLDKHHKEQLGRYTSPSKNWTKRLSKWKRILENHIDNTQISWTEPYDYNQLVNDYKADKNTIYKKEAEAIAKVEKESCDWESAWFEREILKHNCKVGKQNAKVDRLNSMYKIEHEYAKKAEEYRKRIQQEFKKLSYSGK